jgi:hypothetical protein
MCQNFHDLNGDKLLNQCLRVINESMVAWNRTRGKKLHVILNMTTLEDRFAKQNVRLQSLVAAESPSDDDRLDETETLTRRVFIISFYL